MLRLLNLKFPCVILNKISESEYCSNCSDLEIHNIQCYKKSDKYSKLLKISKTDANYAAKKLSLMNMLFRSAIIIFMCLTYTKIISNKPGIQFL